jgi:hypothetical protein
MPIEPLNAEPPKRKRRWFQFSLRTLMIGVTVLAVGCWIGVDRARLIRERDEALRRAEITDNVAARELLLRTGSLRWGAGAWEDRNTGKK